MLEGYIFGRMGGWPGGKAMTWAPQHISVCFKWEGRFRRPISMPVKWNSAVRLCFIGWRPTDAPTIFAEQGGRVKQRPVTHSWNKWPMVLHCKFHKKIQVSQSAEVQVLRDRIRTIAIKPTNCFFLVFTKKSTAFCRWTLQRKCLRSPIIVVGSLPSCTFHHGFFLAWLKHGVPKRPIWSCHV